MMTVTEERAVPTTEDELPDDRTLVAALQRGDEAAFVRLVQAYQDLLIRLAMPYVAHRAMAEDVVQETWLGVLRGLDRFEARSSLKTWICRILVNRARTRAERDGRMIPFSAFWSPEDENDEPAVDPSRFRQADGHWMSIVQSWEDLPEESLLSEETRQCVQAAIDALPANQRTVITLRDIEGWQSADVCATLELSEANQRVLLHRARSKVRQALERYLGGRDEMAATEMSCRELVELVTEYLEGTMEPSERARLDEHLTRCRPCRNYLAQMRTTIETVGRLPEESVSREAQDELLEVFRAWKGA